MSLGGAAAISFYADAVLLVVGLAAVPFLVRTLGAEPYGIVGIVWVLAGQLGVLHLGVGPAATRLIAQSRGAEDPRAAGDAVAGSLVVGALASAVVAIVFALLAPRAWTGWLAVSEGVLPLALAAVPAAAVQVGLTPANAAMYGLLFGRELFLTRALLYAFQGSVRLLAAVAVVAAGGGVVGVLWAFAATDAVTLAVGLVIALRGGAGTSLSFSPARLRGVVAPVLRIGIPFALGAVPAALLVDVEKIVLGLRASLEAFTYYSVPYNGVIRLALIGAAAGTVLLPRLTAEMAAGAAETAARLTRLATRMLSATMLVVLIPLVLLTPELLDLWVGPEFAERSTLAARILMVAVFTNVAARPPLAIIQGRAHPITLAWVYAVELALHFPLTLWLVGRWGIPGAGLAWSVRTVLDTWILRGLAARTLGRPIGDAGVVWLPTAALVGVVVALTTLPLALPLRVGAVAVLVPASFFGLLGPAERTALLDSVVMRARGARPAAAGGHRGDAVAPNADGGPGPEPMR